jgi:hypothetical protein
MLNKAKEYDKKINAAKLSFAERKGELKNVVPGDIVWNPASGLGIVKRIEDNRVIITNPGLVNKDDEEKSNEKGITQGYLVKL